MAVATALASAAASMLSVPFKSHVTGLALVIPTIICALIWVRLLRSTKSVGQSGLRAGWFWSVPLAALNACVGALIMFMCGEHMGVNDPWMVVLTTLICGATVWIPMWGFTIAVFGTPISWAQRRAKSGLAGEERGEAVIGTTSAVIAGLALLDAYRHTRGDVTLPRVAIGHAMTITTAVLGVGLGVLVLVLALIRERQRRLFIVAVEAGSVPNFRVDLVPEGKVLVRVVSENQHYRVADFVDEVALLNTRGELVSGDARQKMPREDLDS